MPLCLLADTPNTKAVHITTDNVSGNILKTANNKINGATIRTAPIIFSTYVTTTVTKKTIITAINISAIVLLLLNVLPSNPPMDILSYSILYVSFASFNISLTIPVTPSAIRLCFHIPSIIRSPAGTMQTFHELL